MKNELEHSCSNALRNETARPGVVAPRVRHSRVLSLAIGAVVVVFCAGLAPRAEATPQFARSTGRSCVSCHVAPPKLNQWGEAFRARGYRLPNDEQLKPTVPLAVWLTGRHEERSPGDLEKSYVHRVELISGGPLWDLPLSYFVEWRVVSLDLRANGTLRDRGGRFEDALINWELNESNAVTFGQFRSLNQYDVSLRLSVSEPVIFSGSLAGPRSPNARIQALRAFAPSGRSPGATYTLRSIGGPLPSDGLFHFVNVPFVGELSLPLSEEARREASFELEGPAKGVFLETFYRRGLNSIGAHAFVGENERRLFTGVGRANYSDFYATAAAGIDDAANRRSRGRFSLELEYLPSYFDRLRPGIGFRVEQITHAGRDPAYIPYFVLAGPNTNYFSLLLQIEARFQDSTRGLFFDLSAFF
ncbi:MAG TPA: hypothetical protein VK993_13545 [Chthoniobacterales bacterium]|nr:hypothetical protein [Chthoniobacterales bacterium]